MSLDAYASDWQDRLMRAQPSVQNIENVVRIWATNKTFIKTVWLFGSRLKGTSHAESDIDLAFELDPIAIRPYDAWVFWTFEAKEIRSDLSEAFGIPVDAQHYLKEVNTHVCQYVAECSLVVYQKADLKSP